MKVKSLAIIIIQILITIAYAQHRENLHHEQLLEERKLSNQRTPSGKRRNIIDYLENNPIEVTVEDQMPDKDQDYQKIQDSNSK